MLLRQHKDHVFWVELWCVFMLELLSLSRVCVCFSKKKKKDNILYNIKYIEFFFLKELGFGFLVSQLIYRSEIVFLRHNFLYNMNFIEFFTSDISKPICKTDLMFLRHDFCLKVVLVGWEIFPIVKYFLEKKIFSGFWLCYWKCYGLHIFKLLSHIFSSPKHVYNKI